MTHYITYWPETDCVDNCGFPMEVDDFKDEMDEVFREDTKHLSVEPFVPASLHPNASEYRDAVALPVQCAGPGFTYAELRAAADRYRQKGFKPNA